jgi:hypothetical protein
VITPDRSGSSPLTSEGISSDSSVDKSPSLKT